MSIVDEFLSLLERGATHGYVALLRPLDFDDQVRLQQLVRDWEEEHGPFVLRVSQSTVEYDVERVASGKPPAHLSERERIEHALASCAWNQTRAAKLLGVSRQTLVTRLDRYAIPRPHLRGRATI